MTETPPENPIPGPVDETTEQPTSGKFAAYDNTYLRYVDGGVHDTKAKATKAAKDAEVKDFTVREV